MGVGLLAGDAKGARVEDLVQALLRQRLAVQLRKGQRVLRLQELAPVAQERLQLPRHPTHISVQPIRDLHFAHTCVLLM